MKLTAYPNYLGYIMDTFWIQGTTLASATVNGQILDCRTMRTLWIHWRDGSIRLGQGDMMTDQILQTEPVDVQGVGTVTLRTPASVGAWRFPEYLGEFDNNTNTILDK